VEVDMKKSKVVNKKYMDSVIQDYSLWAMGAGLIPIPFLDLSVVAAVQLKMLYDISKSYNVEFSKTRLKSIIAALLGTIATDSFRTSTFTGFIKSIPIVRVIGMISTPIYAGATTYAIGKVFVYHLEAGGKVNDFNIDTMKEEFKDLFEEGKTRLKPKSVQ
jgi:uncharacterized protein (DUF697 family)